MSDKGVCRTAPATPGLLNIKIIKSYLDGNGNGLSQVYVKL